MTQNNGVRWGILSTAHIAHGSFLPALRAAGGGEPFAVAGRDLERTRRFAADEGIEHAVEGYATLLEDDRIEAVYIPLPNSLHAEWTIAALRAGKAVLCEKPLCLTVAETHEVLSVARETGSLLWEAFVFPFREQTRRLHELLSAGRIGQVREIQSNFHFPTRSRDNIRLSPDLGGGALYDVGCYPIRFSRTVFEDDPIGGDGMATWAPEGVDEEMRGVLSFPSDRHLLFSCGMFRASDTFSRVLGTEGEIRLTNAFHPNSGDTLEIYAEDGIAIEHPTGSEPSFTPALQHIHAVLRGDEAPRHLAIDEALGNAQAIDWLYNSARSERRQPA